MSPSHLVTLTAEEQARVDRAAELGRRGADGVGPLIAMLVDASWAVRRHVVAALAGAGDAAVGPLCDVLRGARDDETRLAAAVDALSASTGDPGPALLRLARERDPAARADAAQVLGRRRDPGAVALLAELAQDPDDNVAVAAVEGLGRVGGRSALEALLAAARSQSFFRVFPAIAVLGRTDDPRAVPALAELLREPLYASDAARALSRSGEVSAAAPLAALLVSPSEAMVRTAATALADLHAVAEQRYGNALAVEDALRRAAQGEAPRRQLSRALSEAHRDEQKAIAFLLGILGGDIAVAALEGLLDTADGIGELAATALRRLGPGAETAIRQALRDGSSARRRAVLPAVTRATSAPEVLRCLEDPDPDVRRLAADALARVGATTAVRALFRLLADPNPLVVQSATGAIQALGTAETRALAVEAAGAENPAVQRAALRILAYFGYGEALPRFLDAIRSPDLRLREVALAGLPFLDDTRAQEALLAAIRDPSPETRRAATRAVGHTPSTSPRIQAALLSALEDADAWVRYYAAQALGRLGAEAASRRLAELLGDPAGQVRVSAVEALSHFRNDVAFQALREAAASAEPDLRRAALIGLGITGRPDALPALLDALRSPDAATRLVAVSALSGAAGGAEIVPALARAARDEDEAVRSAAIGFLAAAPGAAAAAELVELARELPSREQAVAALAVQAEGRVPALRAALLQADDEVAPLLASALARMGTQPAADVLLRALEAPNVAARKAAASALHAVGSHGALQALQRAAVNDSDPGVRQICAILLAG